ncbi:glycosyltransferase family 2 protein [Streptococcus marimammalium]|uniref:glycosyltransferase family 2 protein n=1 Tax=Streptococcus marimammalium TaxID=269666 RepID=UPI00035D6F41|nr:glycosyltransferase family 2 protein [Streptococcus marimammalium]
MKVNIVMATYNGEKFLAEQIESIQKQTFKDWTLLIRDDGSNDQTRTIIQAFVKKDSRIHLIDSEKFDNVGVIKSFYTLVKREPADFYFFSDQDDVWLEDKLEITLAKAQTFPSDKPLLVYTDLSVVNQNLEMMTESMIEKQSHHANTTLLQELTENTVTGGTMLINHTLAEKWTVDDNILMHDWYLALLASAMGNLVYIDRTTQLYRQHDNNVLGARTWTKRMKKWLKPHLLLEKYWWLITESQKQAHHLLQFDLSKQNKEMIIAYISLLEQPLPRRYTTLKKFDFKKNRLFHTLVFRGLILTKIGYRRK